MEEKKITITKQQLVETFAKASAKVSTKMGEKGHGVTGGLMVVLIGALLNSEVCSILFNENDAGDEE